MYESQTGVEVQHQFQKQLLNKNNKITKFACQTNSYPFGSISNLTLLCSTTLSTQSTMMGLLSSRIPIDGRCPIECLT